ncbi:uncharacterized protein V1516DRAFT_667262 [Lipomyces oligophaga]|uniref:uncharacterized protein n=1 Tax=Lipomyces oligophaga TaxID=45792 RepID=UPI0034CE3874
MCAETMMTIIPKSLLIQCALIITHPQLLISSSPCLCRPLNHLCKHYPAGNSTVCAPPHPRCLCLPEASNMAEQVGTCRHHQLYCLNGATRGRHMQLHDYVKGEKFSAADDFSMIVAISIQPLFRYKMYVRPGRTSCRGIQFADSAHPHNVNY